MITRREFTTLIGAGFLFPRELLSSHKSEPIADSYPIYYMRTGDDKVYQLWQPGIVMGMTDFYSNGNNGYRRPVRIYSKVEDSHGMPELLSFAPPAVFIVAGRRTLSGVSKLSFSDAVTSAYPHNLIVDDGFARPYKPCGDFWYHTHVRHPETGDYLNHQSKQPMLLHLGHAETLVGNGHLVPCKPHCTFKEFLAESDLWS